MTTRHLEPILQRARRHAILSVLRSHPEWSLDSLFRHIERDGPQAETLRELTLGDLLADLGSGSSTLAKNDPGLLVKSDPSMMSTSSPT